MGFMPMHNVMSVSFRSRSIKIRDALFSKSVILHNLPFFIALLFWSLVPSTMSYRFSFDVIDSTDRDIAILIIFIAYILIRVSKYGLKINISGWPGFLFAGMMFVTSYAAISISWNDRYFVDNLASFYTLLLTFSSFVVAYLVLYRSNIFEVEYILLILSIFISIIGMIYSAQSIFSLYLRSNIMIESFGIDRVRGPLFGASTGHFILIPALAILLRYTLNNKHNRYIVYLLCLFVVVTLLGMGSRAAALALVLFGTSVILGSNNLKKKLKSIAIIFAILSLSYIIVFNQASADRIVNIDDFARSQTHLASIDMIAKSDLSTNIIGRGYGSVWSWYLTDIEFGDDRYSNNYIRNNHGTLLYHPHSLLLMLVLELGIIGLIFFIYVFMLIIKRIKCSINSDSSEYILGFAVMVTFATTILDYYIFKNWQMSLIWWIYMIGFMKISWPMGQGNRNLVYRIL